MAAVIERAERGVAGGAGGATLGQLRELQTTAFYWSARYADAVRASREAIDLLEEGSGDWYRALGLGMPPPLVSTSSPPATRCTPAPSAPADTAPNA